jgi:membrane protein DedA with SNARE-associated domain
MAHHLYITFSRFFDRYGYWAIAITVFAENVGVPAPGDTVVLFASFLARRGSLRLVWTLFVAFAAAVAGQTVGFGIGRMGGKKLLETRPLRLLISERHYKWAQRVFRKNAAWAVFVARFVLGLRELAGLLSGIFGFPLGKFMVVNTLGAALWSISMNLMGYLLGENWKRLLHLFTRLNLVAVAAFAAAVIILLIRYARKTAASGEREETSP